MAKKKRRSKRTARSGQLPPKPPPQEHSLRPPVPTDQPNSPDGCRLLIHRQSQRSADPIVCTASNEATTNEVYNKIIEDLLYLQNQIESYTKKLDSELQPFEGEYPLVGNGADERKKRIRHLMMELETMKKRYDDLVCITADAFRTLGMAR
ncbi:hypothetical protein CHU98_g10281 [Xylaria longipes]|nr:hypothetical protein CHU98_g10281 [Xylaria longipes]